MHNPRFTQWRNFVVMSPMTSRRPLNLAKKCIDSIDRRLFRGSWFLLDSADPFPRLFLAANWAALGICYNSGQDCTAGSRVYVQDTIYDRFLELLVAKVKAQVIGDGLDERTGGGPVVCLISDVNLEYIYLTHMSSKYRSQRDNTTVYGGT